VQHQSIVLKIRVYTFPKLRLVDPGAAAQEFRLKGRHGGAGLPPSTIKYKRSYCCLSLHARMSYGRRSLPFRNASPMWELVGERQTLVGKYSDLIEKRCFCRIPIFQKWYEILI
jgi:hypothetical protein